MVLLQASLFLTILIIASKFSYPEIWLLATVFSVMLLYFGTSLFVEFLTINILLKEILPPT